MPKLVDISDSNWTNLYYIIAFISFRKRRKGDGKILPSRVYIFFYGGLGPAWGRGVTNINPGHFLHLSI